MSSIKKWPLIVLLCLTLACLAACGESSDPSGAGDGSATGESISASDAVAGSMRAVHTDEAWATIQGDSSKKMCLSCHPRTSIVEETKDYAGAEGFNPHASHTESYDCLKCHSMTGTSVLVCNTACHGKYHGEDGMGWPLPDNGGWAAPTDELPSADGEGIPVNV